MSWYDRATLITVSAAVIVPWILTSFTEAWGWGVKK
jgi:hypothetical protein